MSAADKIKAARALIEPMSMQRILMNGRLEDPGRVMSALADLADAQAQRVEEWRQDYRALEGAHRVMREANARLIAERDAQAQEIARLRYVLEGVRGAIDTGRNEPLMICRDQINIALGDAP